MVINESGLVRAMKNAYQGSGYKVAAEGSGDLGKIILSGHGWAVISTRKHMPRKALGLIAEHLGDTPKSGEAYQVRKKETNAVIFSMALDSVPKVDQEPQWKMLKTDLTMGGLNLWQRSADNRIVRVEPDLEDIMSGYGRDIVMAGDGTIVVAGAVSRVYIQCLNIKSKEEAEKLNYLGKVAWVGV